MEEYVQFSGKDVDDAIATACKHFGIDRDRLEIDIISGGSSGIFGLVGVKKAKILARKMQIKEENRVSKPANDLNIKNNNETLLQEQPQAKEPPEAQSVPRQEPAKKARPKSKPRSKSKPKPRSQVKPNQESKPPAQDKHQQTVIDEAESINAQQIQESPAGADRQSRKPQPQPEKAVTKSEESKSSGSTDAEAAEARQEASKDPELKQYIHGLMVNLTTPLAPETEITVNEQTRPISVTFKDESTTEVLIGRDGQTLSAIQYIANRIIAKNRPGAARVQLDTDNFLEQQNEKLQQSAFQLASKAKKAGKTMSTKPLSSYHRRIVHMALQDDKKIRTKSKGDGPMKRVLIMPRQRRKKASQD